MLSGFDPEPRLQLNPRCGVLTNAGPATSGHRWNMYVNCAVNFERFHDTHLIIGTDSRTAWDWKGSGLAFLDSGLGFAGLQRPNG